ncbi:hypothetical protein MJD09_24250, partial [bacterium]|nr:hypothetical protein [bacterium]
MYRTGYLFVVICTTVLCFLIGFVSDSWSQDEVLVFSLIGDVPYEASEDSILQQHILEHNLYSPSEFLVHLGDIKPQSKACRESDYTKVAGFLQDLKVPTFVIPGDNEWTDCSDPDEAWSFWTQHFMNFEQKYCGAPSVERQAIRPENFAWVSKGVLLIGLNMPGGSNTLIGGGAQRLQDNADWVNQQFAAHSADVRAAVVFAQSLRDADAPFEDQFLVDVVNFGKPVLYAMGEHHVFSLTDPYRVDNLSKVIVDQGGIALPLQVTVTLDTLNPFLFERAPWSTSSTPFNQQPCVEAGADQVITQSDVLNLEGVADDDGVPVSPGNLDLAWTKDSGPG